MNGSRGEISHSSTGVSGDKWAGLGRYAKPLDFLNLKTFPEFGKLVQLRQSQYLENSISHQTLRSKRRNLHLALLDIIFEPKSVANVAGTSEFIYHAELLVGASVARQRFGWRRVEQRHWGTHIHHFLDPGYLLCDIVGLDPSPTNLPDDSVGRLFRNHAGRAGLHPEHRNFCSFCLNRCRHLPSVMLNGWTRSRLGFGLLHFSLGMMTSFNLLSLVLPSFWNK